MAEPRRVALTSGPGRVLIFFYGVLAVASVSRSAYQIGTRFDHARTAYLLSALAAVVYVMASAALIAGVRRFAVIACSVELAGVVAVGSWSYADPHRFPDQTVWSGYGSGYGYLPLVLPVLALLFLRRAGRETGSPDEPHRG